MVKHVPRLFFLLLAFALLGVAGTMAWVSHTPRDVSFLIPRVEASLTSGKIQVKIASARIDWRYWHDFGRITMTDIRLSSGDKPFAQLPTLQVKLSPLAMLHGTLSVDWVIIPNSNFVLTSTPGHALLLGFGNSDATIPLTELYDGADTGQEGGGGVPFDHLLIEDANIAIRDPSGKLLLRTHDSELAFNKRGDGFQGALRLYFTYRDQQGAIQTLLRYDDDDRGVMLVSRFSNVPMGLVCGGIGDCGVAKKLRGAISGKATVRMQDGSISDADIVVSGERLRFTNTDWFAEPLEFTRAAISAAISENMTRMDLRTLDLENSEVQIVGSGKARKEEDGWYLNGVAKQNNLALKNLYKYWPVSLASETRLWVTESIAQGISPEAVATIALTPQDMKAELLPDSFLRATIRVKDATVRYLPGLAPVTGVDGLVYFTGTTMRADVGGGTLLSDTKLVRAKVEVPDLNHPNVPMKTDLTLDASARDVAELFQHQAFTFEDALRLSPASLSGRLGGKVDLRFDAFSGKTADNASFDVSGVDYDIAVNLAGVGQKAFMGAYDIAGFNGTLKADASGFSFTGKGAMNASELDVSVSQRSGGDVHVNAKGAMTRKNLVALGMPDRKEVGDGAIGFDAGFVLGKDKTLLDSVALDLKDVALSIPDISWSKARGVPASLTLAPAGEESRYSIRHKGGDLAVEGQVSLDPKTAVIKRLSLASVKTARNDFALDYEKLGTGMRVKLSGVRLDNSESYNTPSSQTSENNILSDFPHLQLTIDIGEFSLMRNYPFRALSGTLDCLNGPCVFANIAGKTGAQGTVNVHISSQSGKRGLAIRASDAGELLRAVDMTDKVSGGTLKFDGIYDDAKAPAPLKGELFIGSFNVKQSQVLARLFSVASLSGLSNLLTGSGINFEKLRANIEHRQGIFTISEGRANGASTGYTTEGTVDTRKAALNLKGVLVPAYAVNSIIGNIPVIGAIAGGKGEGLISFNYRVTGSYNDPQVSVNPFSGLTPGFLRRIFDGDDTVEEKASPPTVREERSPSTPRVRR